MTSSIVALKAILTSPTPTPHLPNHTYSHVHSWCLRHLHRDTRLLFLIKEIAFLCWLFYLMSWLPLCAQHQAAAGRRRRPAPLIGAWDARSAAAGPGGRSGRTLMSLPVWASLSPPSLSLAAHATLLLLRLALIFLWLSNHLHKTTVWFVPGAFLQMENRFSVRFLWLGGCRCLGPSIRTSSPPMSA